MHPLLLISRSRVRIPTGSPYESKLSTSHLPGRRTGMRNSDCQETVSVNLSDLFHPAVAEWFDRSFAAPTAAQSEAWPSIRAGRHTLIAAPKIGRAHV